ncbi:hypothetical protein HMPREF9131_0873 [Peptoniphilus sp. oral taxon 836 str. F0141]|nr:hypothetical protein HMPREF9131_0873 [Peptoniphilus sp. oral taxon 836 str. F0141]
MIARLNLATEIYMNNLNSGKSTINSKSTYSAFFFYIINLSRRIS